MSSSKYTPRIQLTQTLLTLSKVRCCLSIKPTLHDCELLPDCQSVSEATCSPSNRSGFHCYVSVNNLMILITSNEGHEYLPIAVVLTNRENEKSVRDVFQLILTILVRIRTLLWCEIIFFLVQKHCFLVQNGSMNRLSGLILLIQFIHKMSQDKKVYNNIINSLFPTIHGSDENKRGIVGVPKTFSSGWNIS